MYKNILICLLMLASFSCKSQSILPEDDLAQIIHGKSVLAHLPCDELIAKSNDSTFSLKNLAALKAQTKCKDFVFDIKLLTEFEKKLFASELGLLDTKKIETKLSLEYSTADLKKNIKLEKNTQAKLKFYKLLRAQLRKTPKRTGYVPTTEQMYTWALGLVKNKKSMPTEIYLVYYEAAQITARTYWTENDSVKALATINEALSLITKNSVAELLFLKSRIFDEEKNTLAATAQLELTLADIKTYVAKNLSFSVDKTQWLNSWLLYKDKKYIEAEKSLAQFALNTTDLSEKSRALFYQARCLKFLQQHAKAKEVLESIINTDFFGYYGLVAHYELGKKFTALKNVKLNNSTLKFDLELQFLPATEKNIFTDLIKYQEYNLAEKAILLIAQSKQDEVNLSLYYAKQGQIYMSLFKAFSKLNNNEKIDVFTNYTQYVFPRPYADQVNAMSAKTKIPSSLIYSIMKQESAFNTKARSSADAMGLMQVIPKLAKHLSKKFSVDYKNTQDLYMPDINIQLGSFELMEQVKKQNGQLTYVAAAYNAGPGALKGWLKTRNSDDILEFIEDIPYDETKTYVKLIARNKLFYERISNRDTEQAFPEDFLTSVK